MGLVLQSDRNELVHSRWRAHQGFVNAGQICISVERVYVEEPVYDEFVGKLVSRTAQLRLGMDAEHDYSADVGAMATKQQLEIVSRHVDDAVSKGAKVLTGGKALTDGLFCPTPVVFAFWPSDCGGRSAPRKDAASAALRAQGLADFSPSHSLRSLGKLRARTLHSTALPAQISCARRQKEWAANAHRSERDLET